jgi:hypothetical protein
VKLKRVAIADAPQADRTGPIALVVDGAKLKTNKALDQLLALAAEHGIVIALGLPEKARQYLGFRARMCGVEHVNFHPDEWSFG